MIERFTKVYPEDWCLGVWTVLMVCVIWTKGLKAHEMQPEPSGGGGLVHLGERYVCLL